MNDLQDTLDDIAKTLERIERNQKKELEAIRFNTGWCLYVLIGILVTVTTGWFW